eukprot:CAMPEP_0180798284 /NCGR_PEP_ID=MMETSP1038_2-20121128/57869_1 /TAXON_ID=632150 /ORGANISM="Azadinium spinosum, Strain 3D9" /LENGTH=198 /DNA_ID=CAMNT_0022837697 /DNA_START=97 /DNA_END=690 /DNA_ORIENTATION=+
MFSAHSSQPNNSTSASLWSMPSASSKRGPGKTPTTWANFTLREGGGAMLQILVSLLVDLGVQNVVDCVHLRFPILLVRVTLFFHLTEAIAILLNVDLMSRAFHRQAIDLLADLEDVALMLAQATLDAAHSEVQSPESARSLRAPELRLLLHEPDLLEGLLLLLPVIVLQARLGVGHIPLEVTPHHCDLIEAIAQGVLG